MLIRIQPTTFLQTFLKIILNFKVIVKSIIEPDNMQYLQELLCCWWLIWPIQKDAKTPKITETLANWYSSESTQQELSNEYQEDRVSMVFQRSCLLVLWTKVVSALEGLSVNGLNSSSSNLFQILLNMLSYVESWQTISICEVFILTKSHSKIFSTNLPLSPRY